MTIASVLAPYIFSGGDSSRFSDRVHTLGSRDVNIDGYRDGASLDSTDAALAQRIRSGDEDAMRTLVSEYADRLTRFAYTIVRSEDEAEGIAYDVLANVWSKREMLRSDRSLKAYLFTGVRHRAIDVIAHERVRVRLAVELDEDIRFRQSVSTPENVLSASADSDAQAAQVDALREAIAMLSERHQLGLHLRFEQGMSYPEIGKILNISDKAAQQIVLRAIGTLRRLLGV